MRRLHLYFTFLFLATTVRAQVYNPVTHLTGTQVVGDNNVTVTTSAGSSSSFCNVGPYTIGGQRLGTGNYTFSFAKLVAKVRVCVGFIGYGGPYPDIVSFAVNGSPYPITAANISQLSTTYWCTRTPAILTNGNLYPGLGDCGAEINFSSGVRSTTVACNDLWNGIGFCFFFEDFVATNNGSICWGDTLKLSCEPEGVAGATYLWSGPAGFTSTQRNPIIPNAQAVNGGNYLVKVTVANLDTVTRFTHVVMDTVPIARIDFAIPVCAGSPLTLSSPSSSLTGIKHSWTGPRNFNDTTISPTINNIQVINAGVYRLTATLGNCSSSTDTVIPVVKPSLYSFTKVICSNEWFDFNGTKLNQAGTYYDTLVAANGCDSVIMLDIVVLPAPQVSLTSDADTVCITGDTVLLTANGASKYTWYDESYAIIGLEQMMNVFVAGKDKQIHIVGAASNECLDSASKTIHVSDFHLNIEASELLVNIGTSITLKTEANIDYSIIAWYPSILFSDQQAFSQSIRVDTIRRYVVIGSSRFGCIDSASVLVNVNTRVFIPSAFSPNGDGRNDYFRPAVGGSPVATHLFQIYDRWGKKIWDAAGDTYTKGWDGTCNGQPAQIGVYYYNIDIETIEGTRVMQVGEVTLIR